MLCKDCKHFKIISEPFGYEWGQAKCLKYNSTMDFKNHGDFKNLECFDREERCEICKYYHPLKHNFQIGKGYEESYCCDVLFRQYGDGWILEVDPNGMCEMYARRKDEVDKQRL